MIRRWAFPASILLAAQVAVAQTGSPKHPFTADDWAAMRSASAVAVAPDEATILYVVTAGAQRGPSTREWHVIAPDGSRDRKLDLPEAFSPIGFMRNDTALYGTYRVNGVTQLAVMPIAGVTPTTQPSAVVLLPAGVRSARLSPDASKFAVLASPRPPDPLDEVHTVIEPDATSLYVVNVDGTNGAWWCPALKQIGDIAWSGSGASLAVMSQTPKIGFHEVRSAVDVCSVSGVLHVTDVPNAITGIAWGDGGELVFLSTTNSVQTPDHVWAAPASGGKATDRTPALPGSAMSLRGDAHGNVWVMVAHGVQNEVHEFKNGALTLKYRWPAGVVAGLPAATELNSASPASMKVALTVGDPQHATNVAVPDLDGLKLITHEGEAQLARIDLGPVRVVRWTSKEGISLEGIATFPAGYQEGRRYPFLVLPHGGPEGNDLLNLDAFSRIVSGLGYVVLQPQYRGSTGYGADHLEAIYQHFGDRAYRDVDSATDFAVSQGWADPNRLAIFGWSAGGFMTSWTVTQTGRYKAAIEGAGITEWASFIWTSDVQQIDYDGRWPEADLNSFQQFSAVFRADRVTTPTLVLHGDADIRVPPYQGRQFFEALAAHGKTTRMVTYPGSGHFPRLWEQRRDVFREIAAWLAKYNP